MCGEKFCGGCEPSVDILEWVGLRRHSQPAFGDYSQKFTAECMRESAFNERFRSDPLSVRDCPEYFDAVIEALSLELECFSWRDQRRVWKQLLPLPGFHKVCFDNARVHRMGSHNFASKRFKKRRRDIIMAYALRHPEMLADVELAIFGRIYYTTRATTKNLALAA